MSFVHLHNHTEYSLLDALTKIEPMVQKVKDSGMPSIAMTDHGSMYGIPEFWTVAKGFEIKPILGCEIYVSPKEKELRQEVDGIRYYHLILLAKNREGYLNLVRILTESGLEGFYYKPRADRKLLEKYSEGLIASSACLGGPINRHILRNEEDKAEDWLNFLNNTYKNNFYIELQRMIYKGHDDINKVDLSSLKTEEREIVESQIKVNVQLRKYADQFNIPLIATTDSHYLNREDREAQKILFCIDDSKMLDDQTAREGYPDTYVKTPEEMQEAFSDLPEAIENTLKINDQIEEIDITFDRVQPQFWNLPKDTTAQKELRKQSFEGAKRRYGEVTKELEERIDYELEVIHNKGYDDYFLVVSDILKWANQEQGILSGVRGSVAGSVVAYVLGIVSEDPIKWELYFERFLNPERPSPPDIDLDIQDDRRDEIIEYCTEKYGEESIAAICAIGRLKTRAAIRDVARVMGVDLGIADKLSKLVQVVFGKVFTIDKMMEADPEFASIINSDPKLQQLAEYVKKIEGNARHMSVHACGYLITPGPLTDFAPLQKETRGGDRKITQYEGPWIEEIGLMKFDFLGLRTLTIISNALKEIKEKHGVEISYWDIPDDDEKTFEIFAKGETMGVFQFESPPMRQYLQELDPKTQEDLCFMVAAYRPGPMKYIPDYIKRKHGEQETTYLIPEMEHIVKNTYGFAIYQEQVIRIAVDIAGYTMGHADLLRRAMGKKKIKIMKKEEPKFKKGVMEKGYGQEIADELWEYMLPFADYGFNKAHASGYAVLAYKCAYLKAHYPLEFMTALMHSDLDSTDRIVVDIEEAKRLGFKVLPPNINKSHVDFTSEGEKGIRFGLGAIKNVGTKVCEAIVKEREENGEYESLDDLVTRVEPENLNKKSIECLIKVGAMNGWGDRNALLEIVDMVFEKAQKAKYNQEIGQAGLFADPSDDSKQVSATPLPDVQEATDSEKVEWEKDLLGIFLTTHPLQKFRWTTLRDSFTDAEQIERLANGSFVKMLVMPTMVKYTYTKKDNKKMAILNLEDMTGKCDAVIFPRTFEEYEKTGLIEENKPLKIEGKVNIREERRSIIIESIEPANVSKPPKQITLDIRGITDEEKIQRLKNCLKDEGTEVLIKYGGNGQAKTMTRYTNLKDEECVKVLKGFM